MIEYALRVTIIGILVPCIIIHEDLNNSPFLSDTFALCSVIVAAGIHVGQTSAFCVQFFKAACI